ncbi:MAG: T9SS type A sorting domain-containing protein [bacterium]|nr:T9SS type A sorting domain-containing protein [bacterium]
MPTNFNLHPIYPNPFNNTANIAFDLPREVTGRLVVYDVLGRMSSTLYDGKLAAGSHQMQFNGNGLSSGAYFVRLETPTFTATQKAVLLK